MAGGKEKNPLILLKEKKKHLFFLSQSYDFTVALFITVEYSSWLRWLSGLITTLTSAVLTGLQVSSKPNVLAVSSSPKQFMQPRS